MHPQIWKASGHVDTFSDPMCDCLLTRKRFRADQVEPQSGIAYHFTGARDTVSGTEMTEPYAVLLPAGKPPESARKTAITFYTLRGLKNAELLGERTEKVENSQRFNPDNGSLLTEPRPFNLMFKTYVGPVADENNVAYLRPETAQAIFAQFKNVAETARQKVPFGIAQVGKAFRNEVTPRNFTFRSREFEQMELEFFIKPDEAIEAIHGSVATPSGPGHPGEPKPNWGWQLWHQYWVEERIRFYEGIGLPRTTLEEYWQKPDELAHYARACVDLLFKFPFGTQELEGIAARSDFDLSQHQRCSGKPMTVFDEELKMAWPKLPAERQTEIAERYYAHRLRYLTKTGEAAPSAERIAREDATNLGKGYYVPHVIEPSAGVDRLILALLAHAFLEEESVDEKGKKELRTVMRFHPRVAPVKVGVFPLLKNKPELVAKAVEVRDLLRPHFNVFYDEAGSIGRRYARQDEAGTPFGVTIDFDTLGEKPELLNTVTIRHRDDGRQERIPLAELLGWLQARLR
jgi:glycyl-tRNA synthetase